MTDAEKANEIILKCCGPHGEPAWPELKACIESALQEKSNEIAKLEAEIEQHTTAIGKWVHDCQEAKAREIELEQRLRISMEGAVMATEKLLDSHAVIKALIEDLEKCRYLFNDVKDCHMSCEQPTEKEEKEVHEMFNVAEEGNKFCYEVITKATEYLERKR